MKKFGKKIFVSTLSLSMIMANVMGALNNIYAIDSNKATIYMDTDQIITKDFEGFGVQWDPSDLFDYTDKQWESFYEKAGFLKPNIMRVMLHDGDSYVTGFDENNNPIYDWDSVMMKRVCKILDFAEKNNVPIMLGEWRSIGERGLLSYTEFGKTVKWDNPVWQRMILDCLNYLIVEKGYTCIKYYNMVNEPNYYVRDNGGTDQASYDMWKKGITQLRQMMDESDVEAIRNLKIVGPDVYDKQEAWIKQAKSEDLRDKIELTEIHRYSPKSEVESGLIETKLKNWKATAEELDSNVKEEGFGIGEMGLSGTGPGDSQLNARNYDYGVDIFDYALQATRAGVKFGSVWGFEDSMHVQHNDIINTFKDKYGPAAKTEEGRAYKVHTPTGDPSIDNDIKIWGFWNELGEEMAAQNAEAGVTNRANTVKASDERLKPWYYTWSMFCRYFPAGMQILETTDSGIDQVRATSGIIPRGNNKADLSMAIVNTSNKEQKVNLNVPNAKGNITLNQYYYFDGNRPMNEKDQLEVYDILNNVNLSEGLEVTMPANTCMIFTTLGHNRESHPITLTTGQLPNVTGIKINEETKTQKLVVGETYQMTTEFTPSISTAEIVWKVTDYFGNDSNIASINTEGKLIANRAGQFKVVGYVKDHPEINASIDMKSTTTKTLIENLDNLDVGTYEGIVRDDNSANFNNTKTIKRSDSNANGNPGIITYNANGIFDFELKVFSRKSLLPSSGNFVIDVSKDGQTWESVELDFAIQSQLSSSWYPFVVTPKSLDVQQNYQYLRITMKSRGYDTYDPQYGGGTISYGEQTASEIKLDNQEEFIVVGETLPFHATVLPSSFSQNVTYKVVETNGSATTKATINENGVLTANEVGEVVVVVETEDQSLATYYPIKVVGGYFVDEMNNFDLMYDYGAFTYENNQGKFGEAPLIKRMDDTPQSVVYAYNGIQQVTFEAFSNSTFTSDQASIYMSEDGMNYDLIDATITKIGTAPGASDFSKYRVKASVNTNQYNFVKFEIKNDSKIYNPMIAKAEIVYNSLDEDAHHFNVLDKRLSVNVGNQIKINTRVAPLNANSHLKFESADPFIATVDENGVVSGISVGSTMITISLNKDEYIKIPVNVLTENYALKKTVTTNTTQTGTPELIVDGDYSTRWGSRQSSSITEPIVVDMGKVQAIDTIKIFWENARALDYDIEVAGEDQQFKLLKEMRNISGTYNDVINFESIDARYVKINGKKPINKYGYSIYELEIYANGNIVNVEDVAFDVNTSELYVGQEVELAVKVTPQNATYPLPVYTSSNERVVRIVNGKMIAQKAGEATITAEVDGQMTTFNVKVVDENKFKIANELKELKVKDGKIQLPTSDLYKFMIESSTNEKIIDLKGNVYLPIHATLIDVVIRVEDLKDSHSKVALTQPITLTFDGDEGLYNTLIQKIEDVKNLDYHLYKPSKFKDITKALDKAEKVIEIKDLLVIEVKDTLEALVKSVNGLELKEDRTTLDKQLEILKQLDKDLYTKISYQKMLEVIADIEKSINDDSSKDDIKNAITKLNHVNTMLVKQSDYDLVEEKVKELKNKDLSMYTTASLKQFNKVLKETEAYLKRSDITTQKLYDYYTLILESYSQLQYKGNKNTVNTLITQIEKEDLSSYTTKSIASLKKTILSIKEKLKDDLTEDEYKEFIEQLQKAYHALEKRKDNKVDINSNVLGNMVDTTHKIKTSDSTLLVPYMILGLCAVGMYIVIKKKYV